ncbi:MAG: acetyl-CoA carboxylase biotin carboxyl carrier protein [Candidatus Omnitrophica bacterium]|nr:acetyl-CoA carboxylase biotin carboxyl carrier protein [Candidatus Omnitrophota bacterium]
MDVRLIKRIIKLVEESNIHELEVEEGELRISVRKQGHVAHVSYADLPAHGSHLPQPMPTAPSPGIATAQNESPAAKGEEAPPAAEEGVLIPSPMVGTFYRSPSPEASAFVQVGTHVEEDSVVCILEAMKVMNEIKAGVSGKIIEILVENGNPVEFGQPLFRVKP